MNESDSGFRARHFTSSAPLPQPRRVGAGLPEPSTEGKPIGPRHLQFLDDPMWKPRSKSSGGLVEAMADAAKLEKVLRGK